MCDKFSNINCCRLSNASSSETGSSSNSVSINCSPIDCFIVDKFKIILNCNEKEAIKMDKVWTYIAKNIFEIKKSNTLYNQYNTTNIKHDLPNACIIRKTNLRNYLLSYTKSPKIVIIGEAPGYKGCHFSGVPFTSEYQLENNLVPFNGMRSSINTPYKEKTATIFWEIMSDYYPRFFVWNCIPFHPHKKGNILTNREPTKNEILTFSKYLKEILDLLDCDIIISLGRCAQNSLDNLNIENDYVRHPSMGGKSEFVIQIKSYF